MEILVGCLAILLFSASAIDRLLTERAVVKIRQRSQGEQNKLARLNWSKLAVSANRLFLDVFDAVYGSDFWSWRRVRRSCVLSVMFIVFSVLIIGVENTAFIWFDFFPLEDFDWEPAIALTVVFFVNLLADFISLQETRWVMERVRSERILPVVKWMCVDLCLTALIYYFLANIVVSAVFFKGSPMPLELSWFFALDGGFPFFVSTFGTSVLWFAFVVVVVAISLMKQSSKLLETVLNTIGSSSAPTQSFAGIIAISTVVIFGLMKAVCYWWC